MKTTLNIAIDLETLDIVTQSLSNSELARLFRALAAHMGGEDIGQHLNNSALRLAFAMLRPSIDASVQRLATNRANGAKGGRPRKGTGSTGIAGSVESVSAKKSKKEELSPAPPKEEKIKKNNLTPSQCAGAHEGKRDKNTILVPQVEVPSLEVLQEQMLKEQPWFDELCMSRRIGQDDMAMYLMDFISYLRDQDVRETLPHAKAHFVNQLPYIIKIYKTRQNHENNQQLFTDPVSRRQSERESRRQEVCRALARLAANGQRPVADPF